MTDTGLLQRFADLVIRVGVNVQPGQGVVVRADTAHLEVARAVVDRAYAAGAGWVDIEWTDGPIQRSRLLHSGMDQLTRSRPWMLERIDSWGTEGVCFISLAGNPDPHLLDDVDPVKAAARSLDEALARDRALIDNQLRWTVVAAPNPGWATQIFGEPDVDRLWAAVATAMRLDEPDPVASWRDRNAELSARAAALDALKLTQVRYHGSGTDLTVGLLPETRWTGGGDEDPGGLFYIPNIPTEEVFTSPDRRQADGRIRLTKPVVVGGRLVEGLEVAFAAGRITDVTATSGADIVRAQLDTDEGARSLGEVSLVDRDSRIAKAGIVFHNTLFDENAGCHVAWGFSFPFAVTGGLDMSNDQRYELGLNRSTVHTDVVIGGEGLTVTGTGPGGSVDIIRDDEWVLPV
ncbi:aminopeptidase [Plantactinospora siamensis]|uniref:Aminopeptidase n=1 Tax=Plantactinospora siamensis TaxID=555372 RepID=A0ABV6NVG1_9ACTN